VSQLTLAQGGTHHAIMVVDSFFENVSLHTMQNRELARVNRNKTLFCNSLRSRRKVC
jgi:hypothetical protein